MKAHLLLALMTACAVKGFRVARKDGAIADEEETESLLDAHQQKGPDCGGSSNSTHLCGWSFHTWPPMCICSRRRAAAELDSEEAKDMAVDKDLVESSSSSGCLVGRSFCGSSDSASTGHRACAARCCSKGSDCKKSSSRWACWCKSAAELDAIADEEETEIGDAYSETAIEEMQEDMAVEIEEATDTVDVASANTVLNLVNAERRKAGAPALKLNSKLNSAASVHANDMARKRFMSHTGSDGSSMGTRVSRAGYRWTAVGENVANGQGSANEVMRSWMNSKGHRDNILSRGFTEMGYAVNSRRHCQVFGKPR